MYTEKITFLTVRQKINFFVMKGEGGARNIQKIIFFGFLV